MSTGDLLTLATLALAILIVTPFLGRYIHRVMEGERVFLSPLVRPVERLVYRLCGIDEDSEQDWKAYTISVRDSRSPSLHEGSAKLMRAYP